MEYGIGKFSIGLQSSEESEESMTAMQFYTHVKSTFVGIIPLTCVHLSSMKASLKNFVFVIISSNYTFLALFYI